MGGYVNILSQPKRQPEPEREKLPRNSSERLYLVLAGLIQSDEAIEHALRSLSDDQDIRDAEIALWALRSKINHMRVLLAECGITTKDMA